VELKRLNLQLTASGDSVFRRDALRGKQLVNGGADLLRRMLQNPSHDVNRDNGI